MKTSTAHAGARAAAIPIVGSVFIDGEAGTTGSASATALPTFRHRGPVDRPRAAQGSGGKRDILAEVDLVVLCLHDAAARRPWRWSTPLRPPAQDPRCEHRPPGRARLGLWLRRARARPARRHRWRRARDQSRLLPDRSDCAGAAARRCRTASGGHPVSVNAVSGYSGGGRAMIEAYEAGAAAAFELYGLGFEHKHVPELQTYAGLTRRPSSSLRSEISGRACW